MRIKNIIVLSCAMSIPTLSYSEDFDVQAQATIIMPIGIANMQSINFGDIDYSSSSAGGDIVLSVDGTMNTGATGFTSSSSAVGSFDITSVAGEIIQITCNADATLAHAADQNISLQMKETSYVMNQGSLILSCGSSITGSFITSGTDSLSIGATLVVPAGGSIQSGGYSTQNTGGLPITFNISYQ
tara:strand:+ start:11336 stop:11893 length:558 start_codon:yes stop_codon:yes gene_type:complete